jgi:hypothetical protein
MEMLPTWPHSLHTILSLSIMIDLIHLFNCYNKYKGRGQEPAFCVLIDEGFGYNDGARRMAQWPTVARGSEPLKQDINGVEAKKIREELCPQVGPARNGWIGSPGLFLIHESHQRERHNKARRRIEDDLVDHDESYHVDAPINNNFINDNFN